jgi:hypothetical protein
MIVFNSVRIAEQSFKQTKYFSIYKLAVRYTYVGYQKDTFEI